MQGQAETLQDIPWYRDHSVTPFQLKKRISLNSRKASRFCTIAVFPWTKDSSDAFLSDRQTSLDPEVWEKILHDFSGAVALGSDTKRQGKPGTETVHVFFLRSAKRPIRINLPEQIVQDRILSTDKVNVAWVLNPDDSYKPYLVITNRYQAYVYSFEQNTIISTLRGHGNHITSIAVHPTLPHIFATTSRDFSVRLYDLTQTPKEAPDNPGWPPQSKKPSLAGPAHGLDITGVEGYGLGRCIMVLMGGSSGGHQGDVFAAAFHKHYPIIATCGMDRAVKIWHIPFPFNTDQKLVREDKPLFSSSGIHNARVLSIAWITDDILLSHSAPAIMRIPEPEDVAHDLDLDPGSIALWRWLGKDRFFPVDWTNKPNHRTVLRGCASDYQESASYKIISSIPLPPTPTQFEIPTSFQVFTDDCHDPLVLYTHPQREGITILNVADFPPRRRPLCRWAGEDELADAAGGLSIDDDIVPCWQVGPEDEEEDKVETCAMLPSGQVLVAAGGRNLWAWVQVSSE
ncbi:hypothetical protein V5O48_000413 [Marasmius crinis-equi]|uniref:WD40 repeat-like protein n=1 Tax=Marasmius crinis-equi TaxID=585013 RepID=A0ABR3G181_9AGAR